MHAMIRLDFSGGSVVKECACNAQAEDPGSIPDSGRSLGEGKGNMLQYSCLGNPMDRGDWQAIVHGGHKSWTDSVTKLPPMIRLIQS